jgi:MinD-like ATPase involved in chromosome partitioning or flagellar assembly
LKIKLAVLDKDRNYLDRLSKTCNIKYSDKIEIHSFTDEVLALEMLKESGIDVLIASADIDIDVSLLPARCGFAYLVDSPNIESFKERKAIFKYQKIEQIYKNLIEIFSEKIPDSVGIRFDGESGARFITFASASGGTGVSTVAAACAQYFAKNERRVLYLNLEQYSCTDAFFSGDGSATFNEIVFALKSKRSNLSLKLESSVRRDQSGVCFFAASETALDMREITDEDVKHLLDTLYMSGDYDLIVADVNFELTDRILDMIIKSAATVFVSDGSEIANIKLKQAIDALVILEKKMDTVLLGKCAIFYNKFSNKTGRMLTDTGLKVLGGAQRFEHASASSVAAQLAGFGLFQEL